MKPSPLLPFRTPPAWPASPCPPPHKLRPITLRERREDETAAFGVPFVLFTDTHSVATDAALAIEKGTGVPPFAVNFDLFERD